MGALRNAELAKSIEFPYISTMDQFLPKHDVLDIRSLLDLAGTKVAVVQQRAEAKDYIDIDAILMAGQIDLPMALAAGQVIYGSVFSPQNALKALAYFDEPQLQTLPDQLKHRLVKAVRAVDLDRLPKIEGAPDT
jgi:hypothetical protein